MVNNTDVMLLISYSTPNSDTPLPGIETEIISAQPGTGTVGVFDYRSTLSVSAASVLGDFNTVICDGGGVSSEVRRTVELRCESE